jgi:DNA-binding transcriptional LysR family regulator
VEVVGRGTMLSAISHGIARRFVETGQLAVLPLHLAHALHPVGIMTARDHAANPATLVFLDAVRESARSHRHPATQAGPSPPPA